MTKEHSEVLPLELLFHIIDSIDSSSSEGRQSLSACACVHHALLIICQERLFRDIELSYFLNDDHKIVFCDGQGTTGHKFLGLLAASPHIGSHVRNLTINVVGGTALPKSFELCSTSPSFSFYRIVPQLSNLQGLFAHNRNGFYRDVFDERTESFFINLAPSLTKLDLFLLPPLPLSIFSNCNRLEELHINGLTMDVAHLPMNMNKVKLRVLEVSYGPTHDNKPMTPLFSAPSSPLDISHLRSLKLEGI
ncbi:hypothetical protein CPB84DRAFT_962199 [Gymnopilus junonius]|uniref:F-box domain-containing protein n=1 Tax=Gymnopilus junonius TaxID=109634 RepID=A0A9P5N6Y0_GYMJU|nr:hypothetical protein CPB84DRAFT_962199 [Gymnopilus junonius]